MAGLEHSAPAVQASPRSPSWCELLAAKTFVAGIRAAAVMRPSKV